MMSEESVRELLYNHECRIEELKGFINEQLDNWTGQSEKYIVSFVATIGLYKHKIRTLKVVLDEIK